MTEEPTTPDPVEPWQQSVEAGNARDIEALLAFFTSDSVFDLSGSAWAPSRVARHYVISSRGGGAGTRTTR